MEYILDSRDFPTEEFSEVKLYCPDMYAGVLYLALLWEPVVQGWSKASLVNGDDPFSLKGTKEQEVEDTDRG